MALAMGSHLQISALSHWMFQSHIDNFMANIHGFGASILGCQGQMVSQSHTMYGLRYVRGSNLVIRHLLFASWDITGPGC